MSEITFRMGVRMTVKHGTGDQKLSAWHGLSIWRGSVAEEGLGYWENSFLFV